MIVNCYYAPEKKELEDESILILDLGTNSGRLSEDGEGYFFRVERVDENEAFLHWDNHPSPYPPDRIEGLQDLSPGEYLTRHDTKSGESWDYVVRSIK